MDLATLLPVSLKEIPTTPQASCNFTPLVVCFSHPLGTSHLCRVAKPALNANLSLEIKRYAATASAPDVRTLVAPAHRRSTFAHLKHLRVKYIRHCLHARSQFRYCVPPPLLLPLPSFPKKKILPSVGSERPAIILKMVVFPAPFFPISP